MTDPKIQSTIDRLRDCHHSCRRRIRAASDLGAAHPDRRYIAMLTDVSELSGLAADLLDSESPWADWMCELTADACAELAEQCELRGERGCAERCRTTALACATIAPNTLPPHH
ncbi:hypothetical protein [Nocardia sp. CC227C]|uniref:hypothetical protein n=1 Tax=Nocardia sp. CC227C TaxID=3044562 RepID=UPI00278C7082|nr:hypothetical protein [Nocardia sp. CC227C]